MLKKKKKRGWCVLLYNIISDFAIEKKTIFLKAIFKIETVD